MRLRLWALALGVWPLVVQGQDLDCDAAVTQADMNACAQANWEAADEALNVAYGPAVDLMAAIDADLPAGEQGAVDQLRAGQKAWISFRDATCAAEGYLMHGGSAEPLLVYGCMARLTEQRTADLEAMATAE